MSKNYKKITILVIVIIIFLSVIGVLKIFNKTSGKIKIKFDGSNKIKMVGRLPISDEIGKTTDLESVDDNVLGHLKFTLSSNKTTKYEVYLVKEDSSNELNSNYLKLYLTDNNDNPVNGFNTNIIPSYNDLKVSLSLPGNKILYSGVIKKGEKQYFNLRVWVSDSYIILREQQSFSFKIKVREV